MVEQSKVPRTLTAKNFQKETEIVREGAVWIRIGVLSLWCVKIHLHQTLSAIPLFSLLLQRPSMALLMSLWLP